MATGHGHEHGLLRSSGAPPRAIERLSEPFRRFFHLEAASGVVLLGCTLLALALANSPFAETYRAFFDTHLTLSAGPLLLDYPLWYWINDALMTLFFFVVGLEIKRELIHGELKERRKVVIPVAGAIGGVALPVLIFTTLIRWQDGGSAAMRAWAVPMATDIAFVVGCLSIFGRRVPIGLKVFLLSLAIVDDIFAVGVIAFFYTDTLSIGALAAALLGFGGIAILNRLGVRTVSAYVVVGSVIWLFTLKSGIHPTVAGVALGLLTPASAWLKGASFVEVLARSRSELNASAHTRQEPVSTEVIESLRFASREVTSPLERLETGLHPWVAFLIMPLFALANAGVAVSAESLSEPLALSVGAGLLFGKPIGIFLGAVIGSRVFRAPLPDGTGAGLLTAAGFLAGIGFTMALFIASLSLKGALLEQAKGGVLGGSALSMLTGMLLLHFFLPSNAQVAAEEARAEGRDPAKPSPFASKGAQAVG